MRITLVNQCFYPDVIATAQYLSELAIKLVERGHLVTVVTSRHGYDDPSLRFSPKEDWKGVRIHRVRSLALGKASGWRRALNFLSFQISCGAYLLFAPTTELILSLTSPPLLPFVAACISKIKRSRLAIWIMDLNPDEAIAHGWLDSGSIVARVLEWCAGVSMRTAEKVFVLDRFMKERVLNKGIAASKIEVAPPWPQSESIGYDPEGRTLFRSLHGIVDEFIVMHSGNHSPCHPMDAVLEVARIMRSDAKVRFFFIGGGSEFPKIRAYVEQHRLSNVICLPYQPWEKLSASLSAADMHIVALGDPFIGIKHPCKIYNILALGIPVLYIGPSASHITDLCELLKTKELLYSTRNEDRASIHAAILQAIQTQQRPKNLEFGAAPTKEHVLQTMISAFEGLSGSNTNTEAPLTAG
jgi:colanic acid biosynthesis glycosyl transferase WcaI